MAEAKRTKLDNITRGDTPNLVFPIKSNKQIVDLAGWDAYITITPDEKPTSLANAIVAYQPCTIDTETGEVSYQLTSDQTKLFNPDVVYSGDIEINKAPTNINTFTPIKFQFEVEPDYGIAA